MPPTGITGGILRSQAQMTHFMVVREIAGAVHVGMVRHQVEVATVV